MAHNAIHILGDWDFLKGSVQNVSSAGDFLSSESAVICAGPAVMGTVPNVIPIGLCQQAQVSQNKQIQQLYEIGSRKPFYIPGRTLIRVRLSRALFDGPSLMKTLYLDSESDNSLRETDYVDNPDHPQTSPGIPYAEEESAQFFMNLASEFFNKPLGLAFVYNDMTNEAYGGFYLEKCYIEQHGMTMAAQQTVLLENISIRASRLVPFARDYEGEIDN